MHREQKKSFIWDQSHLYSSNGLEMTIFRRLKNIPDIKKYKKIDKILIERDFALIFFKWDYFYI